MTERTIPSDRRLPWRFESRLAASGTGRQRAGVDPKRKLCIMSPYPMGRLQLRALAYNLANFLRTLALPAEMESRSLTTLREKVVKIGAKAIAHTRFSVFQMAEADVLRDLFRRILEAIDELQPRELARC